jgi:hypothetical protein
MSKRLVFEALLDRRLRNAIDLTRDILRFY